VVEQACKGIDRCIIQQDLNIPPLGDLLHFLLCTCCTNKHPQQYRQVYTPARLAALPGLYLLYQHYKAGLQARLTHL
jgi:hypothetical protein